MKLLLVCFLLTICRTQFITDKKNIKYFIPVSQEVVPAKEISKLISYRIISYIIS